MAHGNAIFAESTSSTSSRTRPSPVGEHAKTAVHQMRPPNSRRRPTEAPAEHVTSLHDVFVGRSPARRSGRARDRRRNYSSLTELYSMIVVARVITSVAGARRIAACLVRYAVVDSLQPQHCEIALLHSGCTTHTHVLGKWCVLPHRSYSLSRSCSGGGGGIQFPEGALECVQRVLP